MEPETTFPRLQDRLVQPIQVVDKATEKVITISRGDFTPRKHRRLGAPAPAGAEEAAQVVGLDLTGAPDVGERTQDAVIQAGYTDLAALAAASPRKLSLDAGITLGRARNLIRWAEAKRDELQDAEGEAQDEQGGDLEQSAGDGESTEELATDGDARSPED